MVKTDALLISSPRFVDYRDARRAPGAVGARRGHGPGAARWAAGGGRTAVPEPAGRRVTAGAADIGEAERCRGSRCEGV